MSRTKTTKNYFNFSKGFNTEAGYLTFPENTCVDMLNMNVNKDFSIERRNGIDYESSYQFNGINTLVSTLEVTTEISGLTGNTKFSGVHEVSGNLYFTPADGIASSYKAYKYNISAGTGAELASAGVHSWGSVLASNNKIYCIPGNSTTSLAVIDTSDDSVVTTATAITTGATNYYSGGVAAANGYIYCVPLSCTKILKINPADNTSSEFGTLAAGALKWWGGVEASNGCIYCAPYTNASQVLKIDTSDDTVSLIGSTITGTYSSAHLGPDGNVYCIPFQLDGKILKINPTTDTTSLLDDLSLVVTSSSTSNWSRGGYMTSEGILYIAPYDMQNYVKYDIYNRTFTLGDAIVADDSFFTAIEASDNRIYYAPYKDTTIKSNPHLYNSGTEGFTNRQCNTYTWNNPGKDPNKKFLCLQIGSTLKFLDLKASGATSTNEKPFEVALTNYITPGASKAGEAVLSMSASNGVLYCCGEDINPFYIEYNSTLDTISATALSCNKRDRGGISDGLAVDANPTTLTQAHKYNLKNQGWLDADIQAYFTSTGTYPSNAQIWYVGKDTNGDFDPPTLDQLDFGTSEAPRGRYIIDAFNPNRTSTSGVSGITDPDESLDSPAALTLFKGRLVTALDGKIFVSKVIKYPSDAGRFYSDADPTSEIDNVVVDSDGFVIDLPEAGKVIALVNTEKAVIVASEEGIWALTAAEGLVFGPSSIDVQKIQGPGLLGTLKNIISTEYGIMYMSRAGLYMLSPQQLTKELRAENISLNTIQTYLISTLSAAARQYATIIYDEAVKQFHILHNTDSSFDGSTFRSAYDGILTLDVLHQAFFKHTIARTSTSPYIYAAYPLAFLKAATSSDAVIVNGDPVVVNGDPVVITRNVTATGSTSLQYIVAKDTGSSLHKYTCAEFSDTTHTDWNTDSGQDFSSYIITGYELLGDTMRRKDAMYLVSHMGRIESTITGAGPTFDKDGSCMVQYRWDWSDDANSNKWGTAYEAYRRRLLTVTDVGDFDDGFPVVTSKTKFRGHGRALSIKFSSSTNKGLKLYGWAIEFGSTTVP